MMAPNETARRIFANLVAQAGGVEAAAAEITARKGAEVHKGTVSKMASGQSAVTLEAIVALEDAGGVYPLSQLLFKRIGASPRVTDDLRALTAQASIHSGEGVAAVVSAYGPGSIDPERMTIDERAQALSVAIKAVADWEALVAALQADTE